MQCPPSCCTNLTGVRRGSLVVVGLHKAHDGRGEGTRWTVRCDCGAYDIRRTRTLKGRENLDDKCGFCAVREGQFRAEFFDKHGRKPDYYEMPDRKVSK
jgi:hypothetical protein